MGVIGLQDLTSTTGVSEPNTATQRMNVFTTYTPGANEEVFEYYLYSHADNTANQIEVSIYDITDGVDSAIQLGEQIITGTTTATWQTITTTLKYGLVSGRIYAIAWRAVTSVFSTKRLTGVTGHTNQHLSLTGSSSLPLIWDEGTDNAVEYTLSANTQAITTAVIISDVDTDESIYPGQLNTVVTGVNFETSKGTGGITICPTNDINDVNSQGQAETAWTTGTTVEFTVTQGSLPFDNHYMFLTNNTGDYNTGGVLIAVVSAAGKASIYMTSIEADGIVNSFTGLAIGDQIEYETASTESGTVSINAGGNYTIDYAGAVPATDTFQARAWDETDRSWSAFGTININNAVAATGTGSSSLSLGLSMGM